jgi:hypothetical protein
VRKPRYTDPLGAQLPALERNILKHRAMEILLVMFYTEELKRDVLGRIQATDRFGSRHSGKPERVRRALKIRSIRHWVPSSLSRPPSEQGAIGISSREPITPCRSYKPNALASKPKDLGPSDDSIGVNGRQRSQGQPKEREHGRNRL